VNIRTAISSTGQVKGILSLLVSGAILAFTDGLAKHLTGQFPPGEILFFRSIFVFIPVAFMVWKGGGITALGITNRWGLLARGLSALVTSFLFIIAIRHMPLADITVIMFASPLFLTALAPRFLGEQVGWRRWTAVIVGFLGVMVMIRPGGGIILLPALLAILATLVHAGRDIITRHLAKTETTNGIMFVSTLCISIGGLATLPFGWRMPDAGGLGLLLFTGVLQGIGQYFMVSAFRYGEAVVIAPFRYFALIWATLYGFLMFGDVPGVNTLAGAGIVIASGLFILYREARRRHDLEENDR